MSGTLPWPVLADKVRGGIVVASVVASVLALALAAVAIGFAVDARAQVQAVKSNSQSQGPGTLPPIGIDWLPSAR